MTSAVDKTFPTDDVVVDKTEFRAQMVVIYNEITALQARTNVAGANAFYDYTTPQDVRQLIAVNELNHNLARDIAFARVSL